MKSSYTIYICPQCGEHEQFAGFCDSCSTRLVPLACIPFPQISQAAAKVTAPVAREIVNRFVMSLVG